MNQKLVDDTERLEGLFTKAKVRNKIDLSDVDPTDKREYLNELVVRSIDDDEANGDGSFWYFTQGLMGLSAVEVLDDQIVQILSDYHQRTGDHRKIMGFMDKIFAYVKDNPTVAEDGVRFSLNKFRQQLLPYVQKSLPSP